MRLSTQEVPGWPALAWLARCSRDQEVVTLLHGPLVEVREHFACEAVWRGDFASGDLDLAAVVAGTGVRVRPDSAVFVASTSTTDRLHTFELADGCLVSNSFPCLLSLLEGRLDPRRRYESAITSIVEGLSGYERTIPTSVGDVGITFFHNLVWDGESLAERPKPEEEMDLSTFANYRDYMVGTLRDLASNMRSPERRHALSMLGTLSSGYDATTMTALAAEAGCEEALTFETSFTGEPDSGAHMAPLVGVRAITVSKDDWRSDGAPGAVPDRRGPPEASIISGSLKRALIPYTGAEQHLRQRVLVSGFYGDSIWDLETDPYEARDLRRLTPSGLSLSEYRLRAGFIHSPPAFWTARRLDEVLALRHAEEMSPWIIGKRYQRPVPRRILEEAGVPREAFGMVKQAGVGTPLFMERRLLTRRSMKDYMAWLRQHRSELPRERPPLVISPLADLANWAVVRASRAVVERLRRVPRLGRTRRVRRLHRRVTRMYRRPSYLRRYLFHWAMDRARDAYDFSPEQRRQMLGQSRDRAAVSR